MKPAVAVLMGGRSVESEISLQTGRGVIDALGVLGYPATTVYHDDNFVDELRRVRPAVVFNALHGGEGEDGTVQAILQWLHLPYQGSGVGASWIAMDKWLTKLVARAEGLPVPEATHIAAEAALDKKVLEEITFPCVVKPRSQGSAIGVSIVHDREQWPAAVREAAVGDGEVLIERYIKGRECTVAILEDRALPVVEISPHDSFYTYAAKYTPGGSTHIVPAHVEPAVAQRMQGAAMRLHQALGARDYSRIDIMLDENGEMAILECNTLPGLTPLSLFPDAARAAGITYEALVERLVLCALSRAGP